MNNHILGVCCLVLVLCASGWVFHFLCWKDPELDADRKRLKSKKADKENYPIV